MTKIQKFSQILYEELDRDDWGDIDPYLFLFIADDDLERDSIQDDESYALEVILEKAFARLEVEFKNED